MDKKTLLKKYLDCVTLLKAEYTPNNKMLEALIDVTSNTKLFTNKLMFAQQELTPKRRRNKRSPNASVKKGKGTTRSESGDLTLPGSSVVNTCSNLKEVSPKVYLTRLVVKNGVALLEGGVQREIKSDSPVKKVKPIPPARERRAGRRRISESLEEDITEVRLHTAKPEILEKGNVKPPVRKTSRRQTIDERAAVEENQQASKRSKSEFPTTVMTSRGKNSAYANSSHEDESDTIEVNFFNREITDGCIIS